jgi:hypothetical protein
VITPAAGAIHSDAEAPVGVVDAAHPPGQSPSAGPGDLAARRHGGAPDRQDAGGYTRARAWRNHAEKRN